MYTTNRAQATGDSRRYRGVSYVRPIDAAKEAVSCVDLADRLCGPGGLRHVGKEWVGRCPLPDHEDRTPSFYVYPPGRWWCYGCSRGGDVVDLEYHCGDYGKLWVAMVALAVDYGVELPPRPQSWYRRQERQKPARDGIEAAKVHVARRRLYERFFEPLILATQDEQDRAHDAQLFWECTALLAEHLVANMMGRQQ